MSWPCFEGSIPPHKVSKSPPPNLESYNYPDKSSIPLAISIFLEYISYSNTRRSPEIWCDPLGSLRRFSCTVLWPWAPAYCFG